MAGCCSTWHGAAISPCYAKASQGILRQHVRTRRQSKSVRWPCHPKPNGAKDGGEGGIRTPGTLASSRAFQARAFDHSATSPEVLVSSWNEPCHLSKGRNKGTGSTRSTRNSRGERSEHADLASKVAAVLQKRLEDSPRHLLVATRIARRTFLTFSKSVLRGRGGGSTLPRIFARIAPASHHGLAQ